MDKEIFFVYMESERYLSNQNKSLEKGCIPNPSQIDPRENYTLAHGYDFNGNYVQIIITGDALKNIQRVLRKDALQEREACKQEMLYGDAFYRDSNNEDKY